jgi:hypothetical protein
MPPQLRTVYFAALQCKHMILYLLVILVLLSKTPKACSALSLQYQPCVVQQGFPSVVRREARRIVICACCSLRTGSQSGKCLLCRQCVVDYRHVQWHLTVLGYMLLISVHISTPLLNSCATAASTVKHHYCICADNTAMHIYRCWSCEYHLSSILVLDINEAVACVQRFFFFSTV